ncbi:hypothetical protein GCM10009818_01250 [Nakamurella flavida]
MLPDSHTRSRYQSFALGSADALPAPGPTSSVRPIAAVAATAPSERRRRRRRPAKGARSTDGAADGMLVEPFGHDEATDHSHFRYLRVSLHHADISEV